MEVKWGSVKFIEVGRSTYQSFDAARTEADSLEAGLDLSCVVEKMGKGFKIFCRGAGYHETLGGEKQENGEL